MKQPVQGVNSGAVVRRVMLSVDRRWHHVARYAEMGWPWRKPPMTTEIDNARKAKIIPVAPRLAVILGKPSVGCMPGQIAAPANILIM
jgi:hypothetical protein